jgi:hypothetical protein
MVTEHRMPLKSSRSIYLCAVTDTIRARHGPPSNRLQSKVVSYLFGTEDILELTLVG